MKSSLKNNLQTKSQTGRSIRKVDYLALVFAWLYLFASLFALEAIINPEQIFPFTTYYLNNGVRLIVIAKVILAAALSFAFTCFAIKKKLSNAAFNFVLLGTMLLGAVDWLELWWGSTFYYGEVRDKQGLGFPFGCALWLTYVAFRIKVPPRLSRRLWRVVFTTVVFLLQWLLWQGVYEPWNLYQS